MNTTDTRTQVQQAEDRLRDAQWDFDRLAERIIEKARWVQRDMENLIENANRALTRESFAINDLGVLQGNGVQLDILCGQLGIRREQVRCAMIDLDRARAAESGE